VFSSLPAGRQESEFKSKVTKSRDDTIDFLFIIYPLS